MDSDKRERDGERETEKEWRSVTRCSVASKDDQGAGAAGGSTLNGGADER